MATLAPRSPPLSPPRRRKNFVRRCERCCCNIITYFPLVFVYGMTSWAVWVEVNISMLPSRGRWTGNFSSALGLLLYILLNWSYSTAVFTDPGSTIQSKHGYSHLPTNEADRIVSITQKSTGEMRFCKKCQAKKPDRAHHCSTCRRCVLKMDHHCPWLATCVGLRNYKPFLLFITYTSLFCWTCFLVSGTWLWGELVSGEALEESLMPVNFILLAVLSGIIGLVLSGFTGWHIWLACRARTTIESLEKVRYLSPVRRAVQHQVDAQRHYIDGPSIANQLVTIHANALPGVTRPEEGEERSSPARDSLRQTWDDMERQRERDRYNEYLDEKDSENFPNAFDHGWRRNLIHVLGESPWLRAFPICNTTGDGWRWEPSKKWIEARERVSKEREWEAQMQSARESAAGWGYGHDGYPAHNDSSPGPQEPHHHSLYLPRSRTSTPNKADRILGRSPDQYTDGAISMGDATPLQDLSRRSDNLDDEYDTSSDEEMFNRRLLQQRQRRPMQSSSPARAQNNNWNDIPDDLLTSHGDRRSPSRLRSGAGRTH